MKTLLALALVAVAALAQAPRAHAATPYPDFQGRPVIDAAGLIPDDREAALDAKLLDIQARTHHQVAVVTMKDVGGADPTEYATGLFRHLRLGDKGRNDGVLLFVALAERKTRIEVGYGLEGALTDAQASLINAHVVAPRLKQGDYAGGLDAGVDAVDKAISTEAVAPAPVKPADRTGLYVVLTLLGAVGAGCGYWAWGSARRRARRRNAEASARYEACLTTIDGVRPVPGDRHVISGLDSYAPEHSRLYRSGRYVAAAPDYSAPLVAAGAASAVNDDADERRRAASDDSSSSDSSSSSWSDTSSSSSDSSPSFDGGGGSSGGGGATADF